ncbi:MAG: cytochrome c3 family protein [Ignavibacteriales bacterium]|nr:cytochrome c3 family protein [Ignavibacteriales bacterium]
MKKSVLDYILKVRLPITAFVIIISFAITYYVSRPERDGIGYQPEQPIKFSHKLHAGTMGIDCKYCHTGVEKSRQAVVPSANICMNCHSVARKSKPEIVKLTKYYEKGIPIPWKRIHRVPDFAYFNHSVHVNKGIDCISCHGNIQNMDAVQQIKSFTMASCLDCHKNIQQYSPKLAGINIGPDNCFACHR